MKKTKNEAATDQLLRDDELAEVRTAMSLDASGAQVLVQRAQTKPGETFETRSGEPETRVAGLTERLTVLEAEKSDIETRIAALAAGIDDAKVAAIFDAKASKAARDMEDELLEKESALAPLAEAIRVTRLALERAVDAVAIADEQRRAEAQRALMEQINIEAPVAIRSVLNAVHALVEAAEQARAVAEKSQQFDGGVKRLNFMPPTLIALPALEEIIKRWAWRYSPDLLDPQDPIRVVEDASVAHDAEMHKQYEEAQRKRLAAEEAARIAAAEKPKQPRTWGVLVDALEGRTAEATLL